MSRDSLNDLQQRFQTHVLHHSGDMLHCITDDVRPNAATRLAIYANAYRLRLLEALRTDYPALHTLVGDDEFDRLGRAYIDAYPSTHYSIRYFGNNLSGFLETTSPYRDMPVLAEMARLEWALTLAFDAADDPVLTEAALTALPAEAWPGMRLRPHASLQRHDFHWNVPELWGAIDRQQPPEPPLTYPQSRAWMIWRRELQNLFRPLEPAEAWALDNVCGGGDFASLCEGLCAYFEPAQVGLQAAGFLKGWVRAGLIAEMY